jgi:molybdopterin/thiamine biosynthesis adenylyltransferase
MESPDIDAYIKEAEIIEKVYMDLLDGTSQRRIKQIDDGSTGLQNTVYRICVLNSKNELLQSTLLERYNSWYEECQQLVQKYAGQVRNDKYESFTGFYERIISLINLEDSVRNSNERNHLRKEFIASFDSQVSILHSIKPMVASNRYCQQKTHTVDKLVLDLEKAESLCDQGLATPAFDIAAYVLEGYVTTFCLVNGLEISPEESIVEIAQKLHESSSVNDFDNQVIQTIDIFMNLKDKCSKSDNELDLDDVRGFIDKIREITFLVFW